MRLSVSLVLLLLVAVSFSTPEGVPIRYMDPENREPSPYSQYVQNRPDAGLPYRMEVVSRAGIGPDSPGEVVLVVEERIYDGIQSSLSTFQSDLESEGYTVEVWTVSGGSASDIRSDLQSEYGSTNLDGAILIGDIPAGWVENGYGEYPVDLYLMDMNGTWTDSDGDGLFESASNQAPEIWVGRLTPNYLTFGSTVELLNNYFSKNHAYRTGTLSLPDRALAYEEAFTGLTGYLDLVYSDITLKNDPQGTNADDFKSELLSDYEWVHLISHSSPWGSSFHTGAPPEGGGTLDYFEVPPLDPHAFFYVLNCCSNGRWTEVDNLANSYIWCDDYGLAALAQTKVDYTNYFQEYYSALGSGSNLGDAFKDWLGNNLSMEDGGVLFGDPTLKPHGHSLDVAGMAGQREPEGLRDLWLSYPLTDGFHSQGRPDTYTDPSTGKVFATCGTSDDARANVLATSSDGDTWAEPVIVCYHEYWDWHPTVGGDGTGNVWIAWQSMRHNHETYDILLSHWNGSTWETSEQLTSGDPFEVEPTMSGGNGHTWLIWQKWEETETDIEGIMWTGSTWTYVQSISADSTPERHPDVAYASSAARYGVAYQAQRNNDWVICFRDAPDSGPFGSETVISDASGENRMPCIDSDGEYFWVVWQKSGGEIMCSRETSSGWTTPQKISGSDVGCRPTLNVSGTNSATAAWTTDASYLRVADYTSGGWQSPYTGLDEDALDNASLARAGDGTLWAVYGRRGTDLQWDLWVAEPDPTGVADHSRGIGRVGLALESENPFRESVSFRIHSQVPARLEIFDLAGRLVYETTAEPGLYTWNARSSGGSTVPAGVYFARLTSGHHTATCRLLRM